MNEQILKLRALDREHQIRLLYMWIKQDAITLKEFDRLLIYVKAL